MNLTITRLIVNVLALVTAAHAAEPLSVSDIYPGTVSKIYPEVKSGKFSVNLVFGDKVPPEIRIGQTSRIRLERGPLQTAILMP